MTLYYKPPGLARALSDFFARLAMLIVSQAASLCSVKLALHDADTDTDTDTDILANILARIFAGMSACWASRRGSSRGNRCRRRGMRAYRSSCMFILSVCLLPCQTKVVYPEFMVVNCKLLTRKLFFIEYRDSTDCVSN